MSWQEYNKDGRVFWYNKDTQQSTWNKPDELKTVAEKIASKVTPWKEYTAPDGRKYWYNSVTKKSVWDIPADYQQVVQQTHKESNFYDMLKDITSKWTWEMVVKKFYREAAYQALANALERRETFEKYHKTLLEQEAQEYQDKLPARSEEFLTLVKGTDSFEEAKRKHGQHQLFEVLKESDQLDLYKQHLNLQELERQRQFQEESRRKEEFKVYLRECVDNGELSLKSKWSDVKLKDRFEDFQDKEETFDLFIAQLEMKLFSDGKVLQQILTHQGFRIGSTTSKDDYLKAIDTLNWDMEDTKLIRWKTEIESISNHSKHVYFDILHQVAVDKKAKKQGKKRPLNEPDRLAKKIKQAQSSEEEDGELSS